MNPTSFTLSYGIITLIRFFKVYRNYWLGKHSAILKNLNTVNMVERLILRDEVFGYTLFDRKALKHTFIREDDLEKELSSYGISRNHLEHWKADLSSLPPELLYSPIRVYFETTRICNLRCRHCFNSSGKGDPNEMLMDEIFRSLEGMRQDHIFDIRFSGGEFTMQPDWYEILKRAKGLGFGISVNTNGVFEDPSTSRK